ncbi:hypothetical protein VP1G_05359 [Cytospora mali]|uniref:Uncharacterized protein n=1 Tax=Cytospora mali TaxID=578113 RepID=A0A194V2A8_CYTMA|nr:hypothetical protein VP1G_05359 [Valsa mali var. pyri (nom. inval.)]
MSTIPTSHGQIPVSGDRIQYDAIKEAPRAVVSGGSRRNSTISTRSSDSIQTETFNVVKTPRPHNQCSMLSMSTHYMESSFGSHTDLCEMTLTRKVSSPGMVIMPGTRSKNSRPDSIKSNIHERKRLRQEWLSDQVPPTKETSEPAPRTIFQPNATEKSAVTKDEVKFTLNEPERNPERRIKATQRAASVKATTAGIRHDARDLTKVSNAAILRLKNGEDDIGHGDNASSLYRRNTTGVLMSRKIDARHQPKRATTDGSWQVDEAANNLGSKPQPSDRIQELMAKFDRDIKARVEAEIEERRRRQTEMTGSIKPQLLKEPKDRNMGATRPAKLAKRPNMIEKERGLSTTEAIAVHDVAPLDDDSNWIVGGASIGLGIRVDEKASAELDHYSSCDEESIIAGRAVAAQMVTVGKARLVKVPPRVSIIQTTLPKTPRRRRPKPHLLTKQKDENASPRLDLNKREQQLAQSLQPEDFFLSGRDVNDRWPEDDERNGSRSMSPFKRPAAPLAYHSGIQSEEEEEDGDNSSLFSADPATDTESNSSPPVPLFNMPNSPFLYHTEQDDECPSLTTDDDQDRQIEENMVGGPYLDLQSSSPSLQLENDQGNPQDSALETQGRRTPKKDYVWTRHVENPRRFPLINTTKNGSCPNVTTRRKDECVDVEVEYDGFSGTDDNLYQGDDCADCEGYWTHETEPFGQGVKRCNFSTAAD